MLVDKILRFVGYVLDIYRDGEENREVALLPNPENHVVRQEGLEKFESKASAAFSGNGQVIRARRRRALRAIRLALEDVALSRLRLDILETELRRTFDSLHSNSTDILAYGRDMAFVQIVLPIIKNARRHAGDASGITVELQDVLQNYVRAENRGTVNRVDFEHVGPMVASISRYMKFVEENVEEAIVFAEQPSATIRRLQVQTMSVYIVCGSMLVIFCAPVLTAAIHFPGETAVRTPYIGLVILSSMLILSAIIAHLESRKRDQDLLKDSPLRITTLQSLKRIQPTLAHLSDNLNFLT